MLSEASETYALITILYISRHFAAYQPSSEQVHIFSLERGQLLITRRKLCDRRPDTNIHLIVVLDDSGHLTSSLVHCIWLTHAAYSPRREIAFLEMVQRMPLMSIYQVTCSIFVTPLLWQDLASKCYSVMAIYY
jgi:hypothetical protein